MLGASRDANRAAASAAAASRSLAAYTATVTLLPEGLLCTGPAPAMGLHWCKFPFLQLVLLDSWWFTLIYVVWSDKQSQETFTEARDPISSIWR